MSVSGASVNSAVAGSRDRTPVGLSCIGASVARGMQPNVAADGGALGGVRRYSHASDGQQTATVATSMGSERGKNAAARVPNTCDNNFEFASIGIVSKPAATSLSDFRKAEKEKEKTTTELFSPRLYAPTAADLLPQLLKSPTGSPAGVSVQKVRGART